MKKVILIITAALAIHVQAQSFLTDGLALYYPFNGNAHDVSGNGNDGTVNGATLTTNRFGVRNSAYYFNGVNSDILVPETIFGPTDAAWTVSLWITTDSGPYSDIQQIFHKGSANGEMIIGVTADQFGFSITTVSQGSFTVHAPLLTNSTTHVVGVYRKGQSISLYINGVLVDSLAVPNDDLWAQSFPLISALGSYHYSPSPYQWFRGTIDDFRVYTRALSASEVQQLYAYESVPSCVSPPSGLVAWWPGEGNGDDIISGNNGTLANGAAFATGKVGQAFSFNANHTAVLMGNTTNLQLQNFTIEAWIQRGSTSFVTDDPTSVNAFLIGYGSQGYALAIFPTGALFLTKIDVSEITAGPGMTDTNFHHVAVTKSGTSVVFYVDGSAYPAAAPYTDTFQFGAPISIGARGDNLYGNNNASFFGTIDEVSIYNRALSAAEIATIYNASSAGKCSRPWVSAEPLSQLAYWGNSVTFTVTAGGTGPLSYQWSRNGVPIAGATDSSLVLTDLQMTNGGTYCVVITNAYGSVSSSNAYLTVNPAGVSLALYSGITIDGVVGRTYGLQYSTDLSNTNGWRGMANITLWAPTELWFDVQPANQAKRFYRVVPGPISVP